MEFSNALQKGFGSMHQAKLHQMKLKNRVCWREKSLPELLEDIKQLTWLAYPDAPLEMLEVLPKEQFIDALPDEDLRVKVHQNQPQTLQRPRWNLSLTN